jgi:hypothetical protein
MIDKNVNRGKKEGGGVVSVGWGKIAGIVFNPSLGP